MNWETVYSIIDHASTILSVPLAVGGFWFAIVQIRKTLTAAESARDMASQARADASRASVLLLLPQLQRIEEQLDRAVDAKSVDLSVAWSNAWRWQASQLNEHIQSEPDLTGRSLPISALLQASIVAAANTKSSLVNNPTADISRSTKRLRDSITAATSEFGALTVHYSRLPKDGES